MADCLKPGTGSDSTRPRVHTVLDTHGKPTRDKTKAIESMLADAHEAAKLAVARATYADNLDDHALAVVAKLTDSAGVSKLYYAYGQDSIAQFKALTAVAEAKLRLAAAMPASPVPGVEGVKTLNGVFVGSICVVVGDSTRHPMLYSTRAGTSLHSAATSAAASAFRKSRNDPALP